MIFVSDFQAQLNAGKTKSPGTPPPGYVNAANKADEKPVADVFAELRRVAARARRELLRQWPIGTPVVWMDTVKRSRRLTGVIVSARHGTQTAVVGLYARVTAEEYTGKDRCIYSAVGSVVEVKPARLSRVVASPPPAPN